MNKKKAKVLIVLQADNIENDYRLIKQCRTLRRNDVSVYILHYHWKNKGRKIGSLFKGVNYLRLPLLIRNVFKPGKHLILKLFEQYFRTALHIIKHRYDIVCLHDERFYALLPFLWILKKMGIIKRVLWDQRELPVTLLKNNTGVTLLHKIVVKSCDGIASANKERLDLIIEALKSKKERERFFIICNYPDEEFYKLNRKELSEDIKKWLKGGVYVYSQCPNEPERYLYNSVKAVISTDNLKMIITGRYEEKNYQELKKICGEFFDTKVLFTGLVDPYDLPIFIDNSILSIILYDTSSDNRKYCAPNRLYQSIARGIPVLVGNNPPMKNLVIRSGAGKTLSGDGRNILDIQNGLKKALNNLEIIKRSAIKIKSEFIWENQENIIKNFFLGKL